MPTYSVHQPPPGKTAAAPAPERFVFVRDGFHVWAFLLPPLWMLWRRLWLVLILYVAISAALAGVMYAIGMPPSVHIAVDTLVGLLIGMEAATLRRWTLGRRGWQSLGFVVAEDEELAERRFFSEWVEREPAAAPPVPSALVTPAPPRKMPEIIGSFPPPGMPR
jgi:hypothetical protein